MRLIPSLLGGAAALLVAVAYTLWETKVEVEHAGVLGLSLSGAGIRSRRDCTLAGARRDMADVEH